MMIKSRSFLKKLKPVPVNCPFCHQKNNPDFREVNTLSAYITERGKILGKDRTGLCSQHQRKLTVAIKRARFLGLLPFVSQVR